MSEVRKRVNKTLRKKLEPEKPQGKAEVGEAKDEEYQKGKVFITFQRLLK